MIPKPADPLVVFRGVETFTIADVGAWLLLVFFLPGDWLVWALARYAAPIAQFLELSVADYGGVFSGFVSALVWLALLVVASVTCAAIRHFDEALTARIVQLCTEVRRRIRLASNLIAYRMRRLRGLERGAPRRDAEALELTEEIDVSVAELRVLHALAQLAPGHAASVVDLAASLRARRHDVERLLGRLLRLNLVRATLGGHDDETACTLTSAGQAFLLFRRMTAGNRNAAASARPAAPEMRAASRQGAASRDPSTPDATDRAAAQPRGGGAGSISAFASRLLPSA